MNEESHESRQHDPLAPQGAPVVGTGRADAAEVPPTGATLVTATDAPHVPARAAADDAGTDAGGPGSATVPTNPAPAGQSSQSTLTDESASGQLPGTERAGVGALGPTGRPLPDFPQPAPLTSHGPARIIAMCNPEGAASERPPRRSTSEPLWPSSAAGCSSSTSTPKAPSRSASASTAQGLDTTIYNLLVERGHSITDVIQHTRTSNLDLVPANIDLSAAEVQLVGEVAREQILARVLRPVVDDYDVILIDCQPSLGLLTVNALTASHGVIIPLECEFFAMRGVALLVDTIEKITDRLNPRLQVDGILATMYDGRTLHSREVVRSVVDHFADQVFHTVISRTVKFPDATLAAEPITTYSSEHSGAGAYRQLARELIARGGAA